MTKCRFRQYIPEKDKYYCALGLKIKTHMYKDIVGLSVLPFECNDEKGYPIIKGEK